MNVLCMGRFSYQSIAGCISGSISWYESRLGFRMTGVLGIGVLGNREYFSCGSNLDSAMSAVGENGMGWERYVGVIRDLLSRSMIMGELLKVEYCITLPIWRLSNTEGIAMMNELMGNGWGCCFLNSENMVYCIGFR